MEQLQSLSLGRKLILGAGLLLFIDTFLAWQSVTVGVFTVTQNAWHGFWGVLLALLTIALLVWVGARAFGVELPLKVPDGITTLGLAAVILLFAVLKTITESFSAWASYIGIVLAAVVAFGAWQAFQESGESLPRLATAAPAAPPEPADEPTSAPAGDES